MSTTRTRTANIRTHIIDFRGFHSSIILNIRDDIFISIGDFLESLSQAILVGIMLGGRLGVDVCTSCGDTRGAGGGI